MTTAQSTTQQSKNQKNATNTSATKSPSASPKNKPEILRQSVGIDIAKDKFDACFLVQNADFYVVIKGSRTFTNTPKGFEALQIWIKKWYSSELSCPIVMEATGVYYENLAHFLAKSPSLFDVHVLVASVCKTYLKSLGRKSKTDKIDAQGLAQMGVERKLKVWQCPNETLRSLRTLGRERDSLIQERIAIKNQTHAQKSGHVVSLKMLERAKKRIQLIDSQIEDIEKEMSKTAENDVDFKQRLDNVCTIPGIGKTTALVIIAETGGFELFKNTRQLSSYAGLDVIHNESGTSVKSKGRISKKGNKHIRKALYFPALSHVRAKGTMTITFYNVLEQTKLKMKAYVAVQRKLLSLVYTIYKNNTPYNEKHKEEMAEKKNKVTKEANSAS